MKFSLIVCTYQRPGPLLKLLASVQEQTIYPNQIVIVDGSLDTKTQEKLRESPCKNLEYFLVDAKNRGLTKQRNVLTPTYFETLLSTYKTYPEAIGVGGYIINEVRWKEVPQNYKVPNTEFAYDGYSRSDGSRFVLRKKMGLDANRVPAHLPDFAHGRSVSFLPPSGKIYPVEQFMGGVASYRLSSLKLYM